MRLQQELWAAPVRVAGLEPTVEAALAALSGAINSALPGLELNLPAFFRNGSLDWNAAFDDAVRRFAANNTVGVGSRCLAAARSSGGAAVLRARWRCCGQWCPSGWAPPFP